MDFYRPGPDEIGIAKFQINYQSHISRKIFQKIVKSGYFTTAWEIKHYNNLNT